MAGQRLTDKSALSNHTGSGDLYMIVDVSDTTGSAAGTSKKLDSKFVIQTDKISVSTGELGALKTTPKTLVSAQGSGYAVVPLNFTILNTYSGPKETNKISLLFGHTGTNDVNYACATIGQYMFNVVTSSTYITSNAGGATQQSKTATIDNIPLYLSADGNFAGGFTMDVYVTYQVILLS
tara:strand:+ start:436 stop:975 length:540 start_codon:yes stop_codon:yes gene_type:complete